MKTLIQVIAYLLIVFGLASLTSCASLTDKPVFARATVLENGTITWVTLKVSEQSTLVTGDSVWVDLRHHQINDTLENTMKCVLNITPVDTSK